MLTVRVIGPMGLRLDGAAIETPVNRREWSLLAWLAMNPGTHARAELAARFWPDVLDASARASLRSALWALRRELGDRGAAYLHPAAIRSASTTPAGCGSTHSSSRDCSARELERAVELGDGELLAGFDEPWAADARAAHRERLAAALEELARGPMPGARSTEAVALDPCAGRARPAGRGAQPVPDSRLAAAGETAPRWACTRRCVNGYGASSRSSPRRHPPAGRAPA